MISQNLLPVRSWGLLIQIFWGAIPNRNSIPSVEFTPVNRSHLHVSHTTSAEPPTSSWKDLWTDVPPSEPQAYPTLSSETVGSKLTIIEFTVMRLTYQPTVENSIWWETSPIN